MSIKRGNFERKKTKIWRKPNVDQRCEFLVSKRCIDEKYGFLYYVLARKGDSLSIYWHGEEILKEVRKKKFSVSKRIRGISKCRPKIWIYC
jgi:hypothetical protein